MAGWPSPLPATTTDFTLIIDVDTSTGLPCGEPSFEGTLEPEAYSLDRNLLFAARIYDDRYHVHGLDLTSGGAVAHPRARDKTLEPEDMNGSVVQAVLQPGPHPARHPLPGLGQARAHRLRPPAVARDRHDRVHRPARAVRVTPTPAWATIKWRDDGTVAVGPHG